MKKLLVAAFSMLALLSCSNGSGSKEIQVSDVDITTYGDQPAGDEYKDVSSWFSVVPGTYELKWDYITEQVDVKIYDVSMKIKLHLNKTVEVSPDVLAGKTEYSGAGDVALYNIPVWFYFADENGKTINAGSLDFPVYLQIAAKVKDDSGNVVTGQTDMDEYASFMKFLQSAPGTEAEFTIHSSVNNQPGNDSYAELQKAKVLKMYIVNKDKDLAEKFHLK